MILQKHGIGVIYMPKGSVLQFLHYSVEEIRYKDIPTEDGTNKFQLHPRYERKLIDLGDNKYDFFVSVEIVPSENDPAPFELYVALTGRFMLRETDDEPLDADLKETILRKNTAAILFPFLRSIVASVTVNANIPSLVLPVLNFAEDVPDENE